MQTTSENDNRFGAEDCVICLSHKLFQNRFPPDACGTDLWNSRDGQASQQRILYQDGPTNWEPPPPQRFEEP